MSRTTQIFVGLAGAIVALFIVMRLGFALQRIDPATVVAEGPICAAAGLGPADRACTFTAALAGRLAGGWLVTPAAPGARQVVAEKIAFTYEKAAWRMAGGGALILPALVLLLAALPLFLRLRGRSLKKARL